MAFRDGLHTCFTKNGKPVDQQAAPGEWKTQFGFPCYRTDMIPK